ncbi:hypothetical protein C8Q74DRAFT_1304383 [Fomes fomentarius]|nr:hypothetical protein C8Q74DRAFT_1304383 [Fomes fomentarius]
MPASDSEDDRRGLREQRGTLSDQLVGALRPQKNAVRRRIADLDEQLNGMMDINQLPVEILLEILKLAIDIPPTPEEALSAGVAARWTENVLPVCRHWRRVVCSTPSLRRIIGLCSNPKWFALCVARSVELPVDLPLEQWLSRRMKSVAAT